MLQYVCEGGWTLVVVSFCHHHWSEFFSPRLLLLPVMLLYSSLVSQSSSLLTSPFLAALIHILILRRFGWRHSCTRQVVWILTSSLVRVLLCWKRKYWLRSTELPTTCWKWNHLCSSHGTLPRWKKYNGIMLKFYAASEKKESTRKLSYFATNF